jgi:hypothetical protein
LGIRLTLLSRLFDVWYLEFMAWMLEVATNGLLSRRVYGLKECMYDVLLEVFPF